MIKAHLSRSRVQRVQKVHWVLKVRRVQRVHGVHGLTRHDGSSESQLGPGTSWTLWTPVDLADHLDLKWVLRDDGVGLVGAPEPGGQAATHAGDVLA